MIHSFWKAVFGTSNFALHANCARFFRAGEKGSFPRSQRLQITKGPSGQIRAEKKTSRKTYRCVVMSSKCLKIMKTDCDLVIMRSF